MAQKNNKNKSSGIVSRVRSIVGDSIAELGYSVWDIDYRKEGASYNLEIVIDKPDGITIEDCEKVTRAINPLLDEADPIQDSYYLEVSSAGLDRTLNCAGHYELYKNKQIELKLYAPDENGLKEFVGVLEDFDDEKIYLALPDGKIEKSFDKIALIRAYCEF